MERNKQYIIFFVIIGFLLILAFILVTAPSSFALNETRATPKDAWQSIPFTDVKTGNSQTLEDLSKKPVIIQAFTVTCPICTRQQEEINRLQEEQGVEPFTFVALDIDPSERDDAIRAHVERNGFRGIYAASPPDLTRALYDEFGPDIITPSSAPVILLCPGGQKTKLPAGIKSATFLKEALETNC
jgi:thiol-disulfide isomerase/thioredoxin